MKNACGNISSECLRFSCLAHNLNLIMQNGLKIWDRPEAIENSNECEEECFDVIDESEEKTDDFDGNEDEENEVEIMN